LISCCPNCGNCNGGWSERAFDFANNTGLVKENWFRYDASNRQCNLSSYWQDSVRKITGWHYTDTWNNVSLNNLKNEIVNEGPVVIYFDVYEDFYYYRGGIYRHLWGGMAGGHAMLLVGYNDAERYLIIKNSWGSWGENGYVRLSYDSLNLIWGAMVISGTDRDSDGVQDKIDNCADVKNPDQSDIDKDGIGDICDNCPAIYNPDQNDSDKNGCGDVCDSGICAKQELCSRSINLTDFNLVPAKKVADASCPGKLFDNYDTDEKNLYIDHSQAIHIYTSAETFVTSDHWVDPIFSWGAGGKSVYKEAGVGNYAVGAKASCGPWFGGSASTEVDYVKKTYYTFNDTVYTSEGCQNLDSDNDGLKNNEDKCIYVPGPLSNSGCPVCSDNVCAKFALLEDFENISDWDKEAGHLTSFYQSKDAASGSYSITLSSSAKIGCWTGKVRKAFTPAVSFNNYSTISFYAKKGNATYGSYNPSIAITLFDSKGNFYIYGNYYACGGVVINSTQWQKYSFDLPATISNLSRINIDLYSDGWGSTSPADLLIDNLGLEQKPECAANWTFAFTGYNSCSKNDSKTRTKYYYDSNNCNKSNPYQNSTETASCNYCTSAWQSINSACRSDNTFAIGYDYTNACCKDTGLSSDCNIPANVTSYCDFCVPVWNCSSYGNCQSNNKKYCNVAGDSKNCYAQTGLGSDKYSGNYSEFAQNCINQSIACSSNSECGANAFTGNLFCSNGNVLQNFRNYICLNAGTISSSCSYSDSSQTKQTCSYGCSNGACSSQTCTAAWQCKNSTAKYYQNTDCSFSQETNCPYGCSNGQCLAQSCANECNTSGQKQCSGNGWQVCGNYDSDSCLEWSSLSACAGNQLCQNGNCINQSIACSSNSDCGTDGWLGNPFCSNLNVFQNYRAYYCLYPGTINSSCDYTESNHLKQACQYGCENGACKAPPAPPAGQCNIPGGCVKKQREGPVNSASCSDGIDNDGNGLIDDADQGCQ
jgi:hypothetical protein